MKYIKTKTEIIDLTKGWEIDFEAKDYYSLLYFEENGECLNGIMLYKKDIIKQANTIEELTDVYVIVPKDQKSKPYTVNTLSVFDDIKDVLKHNDIYSSIWVNALLKPVAKMNDKGVLEYYEN